MKQLIFREFYLSRKTIMIDSAIAMGIYFVMLLTALSARFGNIGKYADPEAVKIILDYFPMASAFVYLVLTIASEGVLSLVFSDYKSGWNAFMKSTENAPEKYIGVKYIVVTIWMGVSLVVCIILTSVMSTACGGGASSVRILMIAVSFMLVFMAYLIPSYYLVKKAEKAEFVLLIPVVIITVPLTVFFIRSGDAGESLMRLLQFTEGLNAGCVLMAMVIWVISFFVSVKIVKSEGMHRPVEKKGDDPV